MLNEISPELVGKVNKARLSKPAKSPAARATLDKAVKKAWLKSKVGTIKEAVKAADKHSKGPFAIATKTRGGSLRRVPDTRFESEENARRYGDKYHRGKDGARYYEVVEHPDSKKKKLKEDVDTFAGAMVFEVSPGVFHTAKMEKRKHKTWKKYLEEDDCLAEIREYANKNPGRPIILKNKNTGEMTYARYGKRR